MKLRHLLLGRKVMTNLDSVLKNRDITLPTKVHLVKVTVFPVVMWGCESWTIKKAECQRIGAYELWCWRRLLRVPWTARRSSQSILKELSPEYSLEGLMLKLKFQYFGKELTHWKRPWCWERLKLGREADDRGWDAWMAWMRCWLNGHEFEQTPGDSEGQRSLACCSSWITKSWTWLSNWTTTILLVKIIFESEGLSTLEGGRWWAYGIWFRLPSPCPVWVPWDPAPGV